MSDWHTLDFARPDDLPFDIWMAKDGEDSKIYVAYVGNHDEEKEKTLGYKEGVVNIMPLNAETIKYLQMFVEKATPMGVAVLFQRVPPTPKAPEVYRIVQLAKCKDAEQRCRCEFYDDGYCEAEHKYNCENKTSVLETHIKRLYNGVWM